MLRVLHVVRTLGLAGTELAVVRLARALDRRRVATTIACANTTPEAAPAGVRLFAFGRAPAGNDLGFVWWLTRLCARERPHIVHTHGWATVCEGMIAASLSGVPFVVHGEHGTLETRPRNVRVQRWLWRRAARVLAVSAATADAMARDIGFPRERIATIRNGVDTHRFRPGDRAAARRALGLPLERLLVGTLGRLHPVKNHSLLLRAAARLRRQDVACDLVIAGDGPLAAALRREAVDLGLGDAVHFVGSRRDPERVLQALDVFALSSASEGLPNCVLEAMATGVPVAATRVGGLDECVDHGTTGLLVEAGDHVALAGALGALLPDASRRRAMGRAARARAESVFALEAMARAYESVYVAVAGAHA